MPVPIKTFEIKIGGKSYTDKNSDYSIKAAILSKELLKPNKLEFSIRKKIVSRSQDDVKFKIADDLLGAKVELKIETNVKDKKNTDLSQTLSFKGIIFNINSERSTSDKDVAFNITAFSPDHLLNDNPHCYSFEEKKLKDIVTESIKDYTKDPTKIIDSVIDPKMDKAIPYVVQYNETTYGFLTRLAKRYGEFFYFEDGKMTFGKIVEKKSITLNPGIDIINYKYELTLNHINFTHYCHNYLEYKNNSKNAKGLTNANLHPLTNYSYNHSDDAYKKLTVQNLHSGIQESNSTDQLDESLKSQGLGSKSNMVICYATTNRADLQIGSKIKIHDRYDKDKNINAGELDHDELIICKITHSLNTNGKYENELTAIPAKATYPPYSDSDAYPYAESQRAIVKDNKDPEKLGRIRVQFIWQELQGNNLLSPWLRIAQPHGGKDKGFYFLPEVDDEVLVGFENGNAEKPFVTGTLYHGKQKPENKWYNDKNNIKAIRTRNGHTIEIHDVDPGGYISIYDNGKNNYKLTFSTDDKLIKLESKGNIELVSEKDIILNATNNINIKAGKDITVNAGENMNEDVGKNMDTKIGENHNLTVNKDQKEEIGNNKYDSIGETYQLESNNMEGRATQKHKISSQAFELKSDSTMKLEAAASLDIKGSIVKINP